MTTDPTLTELLTIWPGLTDDARLSGLRIARAKAAQPQPPVRLTRAEEVSRWSWSRRMPTRP